MARVQSRDKRQFRKTSFYRLWAHPQVALTTTPFHYKQRAIIHLYNNKMSSNNTENPQSATRSEEPTASDLYVLRFCFTTIFPVYSFIVLLIVAVFLPTSINLNSLQVKWRRKHTVVLSEIAGSWSDCTHSCCRLTTCIPNHPVRP